MKKFASKSFNKARKFTRRIGEIVADQLPKDAEYVLIIMDKEKVNVQCVSDLSEKDDKFLRRIGQLLAEETRVDGDPVRECKYFGVKDEDPASNERSISVDAARIDSTESS